MAAGDKINPLELFEAHGWICCICLLPIDKTLRKPDPMAATMEHLIPLSKGGQHVLSNLGVSHGRCNWMKGNGC